MASAGLDVLVLTPDYPPATGGIQLLMERLVSHWPEAHGRVITLDAPGHASYADRNSVPVRRVRRIGPNRSANLLLNAEALRGALSHRPDVVLCGHIATSPAGWAARRALGVPYVQYLHADEIRTRPGLAAFAVRHAAAVVAVSGYTRELAIGLGADPGIVHCVPNGVDPPAPATVDRADRPTVVTVARLNDRYKGFDVMARALPLLRARVPDAHWVLIGEGRLRGWVAELLAAEDVSHAATLTGGLTDAERDAWLDRAHVFAMPSRIPESGSGGEGFGIVYLEAAAHGLPVVAGNEGGALDAVVDGRTGLLVDPRDHVAVADAVAGLLLDPDRAALLGRAGAERAREFSWSRVSARVEEILRSVAAGRAVPA